MSARGGKAAVFSPSAAVKEVLPLRPPLFQLCQGRNGAVVGLVVEGVALSVVDVGHDLERGVRWVTESHQHPVVSEGGKVTKKSCTSPLLFFFLHHCDVSS